MRKPAKRLRDRVLNPDEGPEARKLYDLTEYAFHRSHRAVGDVVQLVDPDDGLTIATNVVRLLAASTANFAVTHRLAADKRMVMMLMAKWIAEYDFDEESGG